MSFPTVLRACHENLRVFRGPEGAPAVQCNECQNIPIANVYEWIANISKTDMSEACALAQSYAQWTGDTNVPVPFAVLGIDGILAQKIKGQPLHRLVACVKILKALNAPFTEHAVLEKPSSEMQNFLTDYMNVIASAKPQETLKSNEQTVLNNLLQNLHSVMDSKEFQENKFDLYFEKLVPYVQACEENWTPLMPDDDDPIVINQLLKQLKRSEAIRKIFGKYSLPFDIFHVLVGCYACCVNIGVVANWALDLIARVCRGRFFWKEYATCRFVQQLRLTMASEFTYKRNTDLYYVIRSMQKGEGMDCLSTNFNKYTQLEKTLKEKIQTPSHIHEMACNQLFPATVFENHRDQMAFAIALGHVACNMDHGSKGIHTVRKGTFAKARRLYHIIVQLMAQVQKFDEQYPLPWTIDTLKLFLVSDPTIDKSLAEMAAVVFQQEEEC